MGNWNSFERIQNVIEDVSTGTLAGFQTEYGKLVYLASLRDLASGRYVHSGLEAMYGRADVHEGLWQTHKEICMRILEMPLTELEPDLASCLQGFGGELQEVIAHWRELEFYFALLPFGLPHYIRRLFSSNVETLLSVFQADAVRHPQAA
jgi:hypothetical protein